MASRRTAEEMILAGRVQVDGETVTRLGTTADPRNDRILVDGRPLCFPRSRVYILLHKPVGVVCTLRDPEGRPTIRDLLKHVRERVYPVGRLDYDSSGLLLLTNDGELTEHLLHPRYQIPRTYHAKVVGIPSPETLRRLRNGVRLDDGTVTSPAKVEVLRTSDRKTWLEITLREGRNREVRRMGEAVGHRVEKLIRVRFGSLELGALPSGAYRLLTEREVRALRRYTDRASAFRA
ncbi:MAG TPA: pseudouridine synthase [Methylomirabilota bacterium]|nr:pseudouridine synthase [Methylomirabilota bacterium]